MFTLAAGTNSIVGKAVIVHEKVDDVERALRRKFPTIKRVIGHAEPRRSRLVPTS